MSLPSWVWIEGQDFPRLYSWEDKARDEIMKNFQYQNGKISRANLELHSPNFETFSYGQWCSTSNNLSTYCSLSNNLPDLEITHQLMSLAFDSLQMKDNIKGKFQ